MNAITYREAIAISWDLGQPVSYYMLMRARADGLISRVGHQTRPATKWGGYIALLDRVATIEWIVSRPTRQRRTNHPVCPNLQSARVQSLAQEIVDLRAAGDETSVMLAETLAGERSALMRLPWADYSSATASVSPKTKEARGQLAG